MTNGSTSRKVSSPAPGALRTTAAAARRNGAELRKDAELLFKAGRYPRAAALAILAEEEFVKAFVLDNASAQERWEQEVFEAMLRHGHKLGLASGLREMAIALRVRGLSEKYINSLVERTSALIPKNRRNLLKQRAFYVDVAPDGECVSTPSQITLEEASACLEAASEMDAIVMQQLLELPVITSTIKKS